MKQNKLILITSAFLFAGAGTVAAATGGPGQIHINQTATSETASSNLSQLSEFKVNIAGDEIQLPISYKELKALGWTMKEEASWEGAPVYTEQLMVKSFDWVSPRFSKGNVTISTSMINNEATERRLQDLEITELSVSTYLSGSDAAITLPGNITLGRSTNTDLITAYGNPSGDDVGDGGRYYSFTYELGDHQSVQFYDDDNVINQIILYNQKDLYQKGMEYINNIPRSADVLAYTAPSRLGDTISKGTFQIKGDVYQFPAPLTAFIDNGWQIASADICTYFLDPGDTRGVVLHRNNESLNLTVKNNGTVRGPIQNCFTSEISESLVLPGNVRENISRSSLLRTLHNTNYTVDAYNREYRVTLEDQKHEALIYVSDYENQVDYIMICPIVQE